MNKLENNSRRKLSESDKELLDSIAKLIVDIALKADPKGMKLIDEEGS